MKRTLLYDILTILILTLAIIQAPIIYYYTFGPLGIIIIASYLLVGLGLTMWLLTVVLQNKKSEVNLFQRAGVVLAPIIGTLALVFGEVVLEKLDWQLRLNSRNEIIQLIKEDKLKSNDANGSIICSLKDWSIPPISNGGNEIAIYKTDDSNLTVEFYINRGFLDHYSAFVYTTNKEKIKELEGRIILNKGLHINKKLDVNWYRVSY